jgi:hypothetical protein
VVVGILVALLSLAALYGVEVLLHRTTGEERRLLRESTALERAAVCTSVREVRPYPGGNDRTHIGGAIARMPPLSTYPSIPPASGPHNPVPLGAGVYRSAPPIDRAIHSLEHAAVILWFSPAIRDDAELGRIESFFARSTERNHVIVAPYNYPFAGAAGRLPAGRQMVLVAWHRIQLCDHPSLAVAFSFVHAYRFDLWQPTAYRGVAPERFSPI